MSKLGGVEDVCAGAVRWGLGLMLCGTRWLAEFQRRVGKDGSSRRAHEPGKESER